MFAKKIFTAKQMITVKAKNSKVMAELKAEGGKDVFSKKKLVKEFWKDMRADSKASHIGDKGFTHEKFEKFLAEKFNDKKDGFSDKKVTQMIEHFGANRRRVVDYAAEMKNGEIGKKEQQQQQKEFQKQQQIAKVQANKQKNIGIRNYLNEIIARGRERAKNNSGVSSFVPHNVSAGNQNSQPGQQFEEKQDARFSGNATHGSSLKAVSFDDPGKKAFFINNNLNHSKKQSNLLLLKREQSISSSGSGEENSNNAESLKERLSKIQNKI